MSVLSHKYDFNNNNNNNKLHDGTVHRHGPRHNPCPGSGKLPVDSSIHHSNVSQSSSSIADSSTAADQSASSPAIWSPADVSLIKHIPKSARGSCATHLASLLRKIVSSPDSVPNWLALLNWGCTVLQSPKRGGKRHNLARTIKQRISSYSAGSVGSVPADSSVKQSRRSATLSQAISAKLEDGNVKAAIRLLMSADSPAGPSQKSLNALREKHPPASSDLSDLPSPQSDQCLSVNESEVRKAVLKFPAGSSGGPDGLRPQHIRDMLPVSYTHLTLPTKRIV